MAAAGRRRTRRDRSRCSREALAHRSFGALSRTAEGLIEATPEPPRLAAERPGDGVACALAGPPSALRRAPVSPWQRGCQSILRAQAADEAERPDGSITDVDLDPQTTSLNFSIERVRARVNRQVTTLSRDPFAVVRRPQSDRVARPAQSRQAPRIDRISTPPPSGCRPVAAGRPVGVRSAGAPAPSSPLIVAKDSSDLQPHSPPYRPDTPC